MFRSILAWMHPGVATVIVEHPSDVAVQVWEDERRLTLCLTNLSHDVARELTVRIERDGLSPERAWTLSTKGRRVKLGRRGRAEASPMGALWHIKGPVHAFDPLLLILDKKERKVIGDMEL